MFQMEEQRRLLESKFHKNNQTQLKEKMAERRGEVKSHRDDAKTTAVNNNKLFKVTENSREAPSQPQDPRVPILQLTAMG